ncbi:MAG TPA: aconitate hydratase AcnA, partial [Tepidisphaeraceae bacterium]|nr:aconitate hydratase AcnA [Tepidisphaeraceae bacterium]
DSGVAYPDTLVGTDSHTTMINGLGVVGWGVGGIEAEACMLGQPIYIVTPQVVGFRLKGALPEGSTATDLVLTITQILRKHGVVEKFVEFFGEGLASMSLADRATIANMAPEYGATMGFFPVDEQTLSYLKLTGRSAGQVDLVERYCKEQGLWRQDKVEPVFTEVLELDLSTVVPSLAGPKRPQDRVELPKVRDSFLSSFPDSKPGSVVSYTTRPVHSKEDGSLAVASKESIQLTHGAVVIAAITSCTNTSNPSVMVAAGLVAKKAVERGLQSAPHCKTSLAPGSKVVTEYFEKADLQQYLDSLGFNTVGYGCTTCIGNSGPLPESIASAVEKDNLAVVSVLSGNRNFEGRVNQHVKANYLASPPLVVAYALAGTIDIDFTTQPIGRGSNGQDVYLKDIWPTQQEVADTIAMCIEPQMFTRQYDGVGEKSREWNDVAVRGGELFDWDPSSTYIQHPPYFTNLQPTPVPIQSIHGARVLAMVGDSVTTDHISPAGNIKKDSPAGKYLMANGVQPADFNQYGTRRGGHEVMVRGTFANIRLKNLLAPGTEGGVTKLLVGGGQWAAGSIISIYDASMEYQKQGLPLVVLAGKDYGMGSSRDWAAKGTMLLGGRAVIAESFERIHRSNLVGMGILPLVYKPGESRTTLGLTGEEVFEIAIDDQLKPGQEVAVRAGGKTFQTICRIDTPVELDYYRNGGILQTVLRKMI